MLHRIMGMPEQHPGHGPTERTPILKEPWYHRKIGEVSRERPEKDPLTVTAVAGDITKLSGGSLLVPSSVPFMIGYGRVEKAVLKAAGMGPFLQAEAFVRGRKAQAAWGRSGVAQGEAFVTNPGNLGKQEGKEGGVDHTLFSFVTFRNSDGQWEMPDEHIAHAVRLALFKTELTGDPSLAIPFIGYGEGGKPLPTVLRGIEEGVEQYLRTPLYRAPKDFNQLYVVAFEPTEEVEAGLQQSLYRLAA